MALLGKHPVAALVSPAIPAALPLAIGGIGALINPLLPKGPLRALNRIGEGGALGVAAGIYLPGALSGVLASRSVAAGLQGLALTVAAGAGGAVLAGMTVGPMLAGLVGAGVAAKS